jgi:hypothetical protein
MYLPYEMLRHLAPESMTTGQQRAADEQLGEIAALLSRGSRGRRVAHARRTDGKRPGGLVPSYLSKQRRKPTARGAAHHAA